MKTTYDLTDVLRAAEALAHAAEDLLYIEGGSRETLRKTWREFCSAADSCTDPVVKKAQVDYWTERDS